MSTNLTTLAHTLRQELSARGIDISLGHTHQLLAAALGYQSFAAWQAAQAEPDTFNSSMHWMVDMAQMQSRAASLDLTVDCAAFTSGLMQASRRSRGAIVYDSLAAFQEAILIQAQDAAVEDEDVGVQMANTNCTGPFDSNLEDNTTMTDALPEIGDDLELEFIGNVEGDQDSERGFFGDTVDVKVVARLPMLGRRLAGQPQIEVNEAALDWSWTGAGDDNTDDDAENDSDEPRFTRAEALAGALDIPVEDAEALEDAEIYPHETNAGAEIGYIVDITQCARRDLVRKLSKIHGTTSIFVMGAMFEYIRHDPRD